MRKLYIYLSMITGMLFMLALGAQAQRPIFKAESGKTFYAGVASDPGKYFGATNNGGIVSFDPAAPYSDKINRVSQMSDMILAGAMVKDETAGNKYYAMLANAQGEATDFCTIDFKTGNKTVLGKASKLSTMYYDAKAGKMYGIAIAETGSTLSTIDLATGNLTKVKDLSVKVVAACVWEKQNAVYSITADGSLYRIDTEDNKGKIYNGSNYSYPKIEEAGQSLLYDGDDLYWLAYAKEGKETAASCFLAKINAIQQEYTKIGGTNPYFGDGKVRLTGLAPDMTNAGGSTPAPVLSGEFYMSIQADYVEMDGGFLKSDLSSPYKKLETVRTYPGDMGTNDFPMTCAGAMVDGTYYAILGKITGMASYSAKEFCTIDLETGKSKKVGDANTTIISMAYSSKEKKMYGLTTGKTSKLYTIDLTTGATTEVCSFEEKTLLGIFIEKDGTIYAMSEGEISSVNIATKTLTSVMEFAAIKPSGEAQSFAYQGNKLYWLANAYYNNSGIPKNFLASIDLANKTITKIGGTASEDYFKDMIYTGLAFAPVAKGTTKLVTIKTYGDIQMADLPDDQKKCAHVESFYYDDNNMLSRSSVRGYQVDGVTLDPMKYSIYKYNSENQLIESSYRQYGMYDGVYKIYAAPKGFVYYTYTNGQLTKKEETEANCYYEYVWDGKNITKETKMQYNSAKGWYLMYEHIYSDFLAGADNCPQKVESEGAYGNTHNFTGEYTYENNLKRTYTTYTLDKTPKPNTKEEWVYDADGKLIKYIKYKVKSNDFVEDAITNYTAIDEYNTKIHTVGEPTFKIETVQEIDGNTAPLNLKVEDKSTAASPNSFLLTWAAPEGLPFTPSYDIFRNGVLVKRVTETTYTDNQLENDTVYYDYFIQTVDAATGVLYNVSNTVNKEKVVTKLIPASNIKYLSHEKYTSPYEGYMVTVTWDAPVSDYKPLGYNIYVGLISAMPRNFDKSQNDVKLITGTQYTADFGPLENGEGEEEYITIEAVYPIGRIKTEPVLINATGSSIEENTISSMVEFNNNEMIINGEYTSLDMYNTNGSLVKTITGVSRVDMSSLPAGIYMVRINQNGKVETIKTIKK